MKGQLFCVFGILFSWRQLLRHCLQFGFPFKRVLLPTNRENHKFQKLHYPLKQDYDLKKIS